MILNESKYSDYEKLIKSGKDIIAHNSNEMKEIDKFMMIFGYSTSLRNMTNDYRIYQNDENKKVKVITKY